MRLSTPWGGTANLMDRNFMTVYIQNYHRFSDLIEIKPDHSVRFFSDFRPLEQSDFKRTGFYSMENGSLCCLYRNNDLYFRHHASTFLIDRNSSCECRIENMEKLIPSSRGSFKLHSNGILMFDLEYEAFSHGITPRVPTNWWAEHETDDFLLYVSGIINNRKESIWKT